MKHTIQAIVENKFGVLARIASLFSARGYNIISLAVGETQDPTVSCVTIVVDAEDEAILEQIKKQLNKLIDVVSVVDITRKGYVDRELILLKISDKGDAKKILNKIINEYFVKIIDEKDNNFVVEICADHNQVDDILKKIKDLEIKELVRTGKIAIGK